MLISYHLVTMQCLAPSVYDLFEENKKVTNLYVVLSVKLKGKIILNILNLDKISLKTRQISISNALYTSFEKRKISGRTYSVLNDQFPISKINTLFYIWYAIYDVFVIKAGDPYIGMHSWLRVRLSVKIAFKAGKLTLFEWRVRLNSNFTIDD